MNWCSKHSWTRTSTRAREAACLKLPEPNFTLFLAKAMDARMPFRFRAFGANFKEEAAYIRGNAHGFFRELLTPAARLSLTLCPVKFRAPDANFDFGILSDLHSVIGLDESDTGSNTIDEELASAVQRDADVAALESFLVTQAASNSETMKTIASVFERLRNLLEQFKISSPAADLATASIASGVESAFQLMGLPHKGTRRALYIVTGQIQEMVRFPGIHADSSDTRRADRVKKALVRFRAQRAD